MTGKEIWRALPSESELGVAQPIIITAGGTRQLIIWYPGRGRLARSGDRQDVLGAAVQGRRVDDRRRRRCRAARMLFFTNFYDGPMMLALDEKKPARDACSGRARATTRSRPTACTAVITTPVIVGDHIYGICSYGQFRCLLAEDRRARLGNAGGDEGAGALGVGPDRAARRSRCSSTTIAASSSSSSRRPEGYQEISRTFLHQADLAARQPPRAGRASTGRIPPTRTGTSTRATTKRSSARRSRVDGQVTRSDYERAPAAMPSRGTVS